MLVLCHYVKILFISVLFISEATATCQLAINTITSLMVSHKSDDISNGEITSNILFKCNMKSDESYTKITYENAYDQLPTKCIHNKNGPVLFLFDGFVPGPTAVGAEIDLIFKAFQKRPEVNLIALNYTQLVSSQDCAEKHSNAVIRVFCTAKAYVSSYHNATLIAKAVSNLIISLINNNKISKSNIRLLGFSMGAQIMFQIGKIVHHKLQWKIRRATGLEPAFPLYFCPEIMAYKHYFDFLDVIHSNQGMYGTPVKTGTVDFYLNWPSIVQPGCRNKPLFPLTTGFNFTATMCSHLRAMEVYAEMIKNSKGFPACCNTLPFLKCSKPTFMEYDLSTKVKGFCFVKTNSRKPYARNI